MTFVFLSLTQFSHQLERNKCLHDLILIYTGYSIRQGLMVDKKNILKIIKKEENDH